MIYDEMTQEYNPNRLSKLEESINPTLSTLASADSISLHKESTIVPASYYLTVKQLYDAYETNELAAAQCYEGGFIVISDIIQRIHEYEFKDYCYVVIGEKSSSWNCVRCEFPKSQRSRLTNLQKGESISIKGKIQSKDTLGIELNKCVILGW